MAFRERMAAFKSEVAECVQHVEKTDILPSTTADIVVDVVLLNGLPLIEGLTDPLATFGSMGLACLEGAVAGVAYNFVANTVRKYRGRKAE